MSVRQRFDFMISCIVQFILLLFVCPPVEMDSGVIIAFLLHQFEMFSMICQVNVCFKNCSNKATHQD